MKHILVFNLDDALTPFQIYGYSFFLIKKSARKRFTYSSVAILKDHRKMSLTARVVLPEKQKDSILRRGGKISPYRKIKFIDDLLVLISICTGKNVIPKSYQKLQEFPLCSMKHCKKIVKNSVELKKLIKLAVSKIKDQNWQRDYDNGFHVRSFYNASNVFVTEPRFLADVTIWEYLFLCHHKNMNYKQVEIISLENKLRFIIKHFLFPNLKSISDGKVRIFSDLRNQLSHSGNLHVSNPNSPFKNLSYDDCKNYIDLFSLLTQAIVLKTLGINVFTLLGESELKELVDAGRIAAYHSSSVSISP